jgi:hypothetical protein
MKYINNEHLAETERREGQEVYGAYFEYLTSIKDQLPASAYEFAMASWHYNPGDHQCPHDAWVESLSIIEVSSGDRHEERSIEIKIRLLGAYHDGFAEMKYVGVKSYSLCTPAEFRLPPLGVGHGDWLVDEIRISDRGLVLHEIEFSRGSNWLIECQDIYYSWQGI